MIYGLGPRARRVHSVLRDRIARGDLAPGARLPSHRDLAIEFGVAPLTVRQVLSQLEAEGLVSRQVGRGTFVRLVAGSAILIVEQRVQLAAFLADYIRQAGYRALTASDAASARAILGEDLGVVVALADVHLPTPREGTQVIRALRSRWPHLPLAVIVTDLSDLTELFGTSEWPLHILPKPVNLGLLDELLRLVASRATPAD
jgi:DNA-binding transcriptional regulator YhcF (GntR family)